ncbi:MAG: hypothetical protein SWO11_16490 [Thermodesulfobacteriota bacterium]|nr:hypothetical protein [Thermodesulfobacteriota bacterium]
MAKRYNQIKTLTRGYHSYSQNRLHILDVMLARGHGGDIGNGILIQTYFLR